jgi:tetratricopeptide (TPR) repeat protein
MDQVIRRIESKRGLTGGIEMKRIFPGCAALFLALLLPAIAAAQNSASIAGQVFDRDGKPWAGVTVEVKSEAGRIFTLKTDKDGKFTQVGLAGGLYTFTLTKPPELPSPGYTEKHPLSTDAENPVSFNFKEIVAHSGGPSAEELKKRDDQANAFKNMKANFQAGLDAMTDVAEQRKQLSAAPADQKAAIKDKISADYQTAITSFQEAEKGVDAKDVGNHAVVWANLGQAYDGAGKYDDAANAYQKAIDLKPAPEYYANLGTATANAGASQTDPNVLQQKVATANGACDKVASLDSTPAGALTAARCWKNLGIVLNNKGDFKDAVPALQKATQADAKDAQSWYLMGNSYTGMIDAKQTGDKTIFIIPPGTAEAYQKVIEIDPNGPYAALSKMALDQLNAMGAGVSTTVGEKRPTKKK